MQMQSRTMKKVEEYGSYVEESTLIVDLIRNTRDLSMDLDIVLQVIIVALRIRLYWKP